MDRNHGDGNFSGNSDSQDFVGKMIMDFMRTPGSVYLIDMDRRDISRMNTDIITSLIDLILAREAQVQAAGKLAFEISGYDYDPRDPVHIPEIRAFFQELDRKAPIVPFFLENEQSDCLVHYAAMLNETWFEDDDVIQDEDDLNAFIEMKSRIIFSACQAWRTDPAPHIQRLYEAFDLEMDPDLLQDIEDSLEP